jgi:hypothetical protein
VIGVRQVTTIVGGAIAASLLILDASATWAQVPVKPALLNATPVEPDGGRKAGAGRCHATRSPVGAECGL